MKKPKENTDMAIELRVPTILRTYTGGEKAVSGDGTTLAEFIDNVNGNHPGLKERIVEGEPEELRRFVNVYVNDEDVRFTGGLSTGVKDGDVVVVLPAVAGGASCVSTACSTRSAVRRWSACRSSRRRATCGCGPSWRTTTRPVRS